MILYQNMFQQVIVFYLFWFSIWLPEFTFFLSIRKRGGECNKYLCCIIRLWERNITPTPLLIPGLKKVDSSSQTGSCAPPFNVCRTIIINTYQIMLQICFITQVEKHQRSTTTKIMLHCHPWGTFFITNGCNKKVEPCILWTKKVLINLPEWWCV